MHRIEIRLATPSDSEYIALLGRIIFTEIFGRLFKDYSDLLSYYEQTFSVAKIKKGLLNPKNVFWLALVHDLPVGYSKLKRNSQSQFIESD